MKEWLLFILFLPDLLKAGTTVIHVETEGWGTIQYANGSTQASTRGAFFWDGTNWVTNNTAAHMYYTDLRTGQRLKEYNIVNVSDRTAISPVFDSLSFHIVRQNYQYSYQAKDGGTYQYEAVEYLISDTTAKKVVIRSRGTGNGIANCYFDIFVEVAPNEVTAIRNDPQWFTYPVGMNMAQALGQNSPTQYLTGTLPTTDGYYFMDSNGGSDMGGISYNFHTGTLTGNPNIAGLSPSYPIDFMVKFMDGRNQLEEFKFLPKLISETYFPKATTFVLSNEGGLIDDLIRAGHGTKNLYQTLEILKPKSGGVISDEFMATLSNCPAGSEIFTAPLSVFGGLNNPLCVNTDGTLAVQAIFGKDYFIRDGYTTIPSNQNGYTSELFTSANSAEKYIDAGSGTSGGTVTNYKAFAIAWKAATTFVLSNEAPGYLIDHLIATGYGNTNLYQVLVALMPTSGGIISDEFMAALAKCPAGSEIFTAALSIFGGLNNPVGVNSDGTLLITGLYGKDYFVKTGYETHSGNQSGVGAELFTYSVNPVYNIDTGVSSTTYNNYKAFAIAWSNPATPRAITVTANSGQSKVIGAADPVFTYTVSPALDSGDSFTGALSRVAGENAGTYTITLGTLSAGAKYAITFVSANFTITTVNPLPSSAGTITGTTTVCQKQSSVTYTVPAIANATSYIWTLPSGATGISVTNSITVNYGQSVVSGNITVKGHNSYGNGAASTLAVTVNLLPSSAGTITGTAAVCQNQSSVTYTVPAIANATSYVWTLPSGATGTSTTNSITVNYGASAVSGSITVKGHNSCGDGTASTRAITVNPLPAGAGTITGTATVCQNQSSVTYTVPSIPNATSILWTLPSGAIGTSTSNSITVNYGTSAVSGNITVKGQNSCGDGPASTLAVTVNPLPAAAETISGTTTVCQNQSSVTYNVPSISNATSYLWTLPSGATGTSTTNSITVNYGASSVSGSITVKGHNSCGDGGASTLAITVNLLPSSAGTITGTAAVCQNQSSVTYTVPAIANATSYVWTLPSGATGTSATNSITVNYGASSVSGSITVKGHNSCGDGPASTLAVTVNLLPSSAGTITGTAAVCQNQSSVTYTVPAIANATSYVWTLPSGATGTSTTNSITVNYGASAVSGSITVKGHNSCGDGTASTRAITVNPLPAGAGTITGTATVCQNQSSVTYTVPSIPNATSILWTLPSGAIGTSTSNSITVNYGTSAVSGNITVKGQNSCGDGPASTLAVTVNPLPAAAETISGTTTVCQNQSSVTYNVPSISNATSYLWTLPSGATGTSTTNSITVNYGASSVSGSITVKGHNDCGDGTTSTLAIIVNQLTANAGTISGTTTVCQGQNSVTYTVPAIANATSYVWTLPSGATGISTTNSITVHYGSSAVSGNISVKGHNDCRDGGYFYISDYGKSQTCNTCRNIKCQYSAFKFFRRKPMVQSQFTYQWCYKSGLYIYRRW